MKKFTLFMIMLLGIAQPASSAFAETLPMRVLSVNTLADKFYQKYYNGDRNNKMDWSVRSNYLRRYLQGKIDASITEKNNLVIALQECDNQCWDVVKTLRLPDESSLYHSKSNSDLAFIVVGNKSAQFYESPDIKNNRFIFMQCSFDGQTTMNVVNTHFYGGTGPKKDYRGYREEQMRGLAQYIKQVDNVYSHWVVCGDFNTDSRKDSHIYASLFSELNESGVAFSDSNSEQPSKRVSAYALGRLQNIDYLFMSPGVKIISHEVEPKTTREQSLLSHGDGNGGQFPDKNRTWFSDHCATNVLLSTRVEHYKTQNEIQSEIQKRIEEEREERIRQTLACYVNEIHGGKRDS